MGGSGDWTIDYGNAGEIASKTLGGLAPHEIEGIASSTPDMLRKLMDAAEEAENQGVIGVVGAFAYLGAAMSAGEQRLAEQGIFTSHNIYQPCEYLDVAAKAFPELEDEAEKSRNRNSMRVGQVKPTGLFKRLGNWASRKYQPINP